MTALAIGEGHVAAITWNGKLRCFGYNFNGQCDVPSELHSVVAVDAAGSHTVAITASGDLCSFGSHNFRQCALPADLGRVIAVGTAVPRTVLLTASGAFHWFGEKIWCSIPPGLTIRGH